MSLCPCSVSPPKCERGKGRGLRSQGAGGLLVRVPVLGHLAARQLHHRGKDIHEAGGLLNHPAGREHPRPADDSWDSDPTFPAAHAFATCKQTGRLGLSRRSSSLHTPGRGRGHRLRAETSGQNDPPSHLGWQGVRRDSVSWLLSELTAKAPQVLMGGFYRCVSTGGTH